MTLSVCEFIHEGVYICALVHESVPVCCLCVVYVCVCVCVCVCGFVCCGISSAHSTPSSKGVEINQHALP